MPLIEYTKKGLYCPPAKVYIDPTSKVDNALITHGHSDHARHGHKYYVCANSSVNILKHRLGHNISIRGLDFGESLTVNSVKFSFHPAGHIVGSAQIRAEYRGEIWVASGDYKIENDSLSTPYEPVKCHHFITECTFGLPIFRWEPQEVVIHQMLDWWKKNASENRTSIILAYSLGKAQRIISSLGDAAGPIYTHDTIDRMNKVIQASGFALPKTSRLEEDIDTKILQKALIITPNIRTNSPWMKKLTDYSLGIASGWMAIRKNRNRNGADSSFVLSDHCDWAGLNKAIKMTGAENIYPTHGNTISFSKWLIEQGYHARPIKNNYGTIDELSENDY